MLKAVGYNARSGRHYIDIERFGIDAGAQIVRDRGDDDAGFSVVQRGVRLLTDVDGEVAGRNVALNPEAAQRRCGGIRFPGFAVLFEGHGGGTNAVRILDVDAHRGLEADDFHGLHADVRSGRGEEKSEGDGDENQQQ